MGELYKEMGLINSGHTVQATRADLVGQYIGHTGPKTKEMITRSFGGILFIDEAYGLYKEDSRDYGSEVIEMLVKFMDTTANTDFIVVLAGYRNLMTKMLNANLNLMSRMGNWIDFPDYDDAELLQISQLLAKTYGYDYDESSKKVFTEVRVLSLLSSSFFVLLLSSLFFFSCSLGVSSPLAPLLFSSLPHPPPPHPFAVHEPP